MIKFYEEVTNFLQETLENYDGEVEVREGSFNVLKEYFDEMSDFNKYTLSESSDNRTFVFDFEDDELNDVKVELTLEDKKDFIETLDRIDEEAIEDFKEIISEMLTESDFKKFLVWSEQFESKYAWDGDSYES